MAANLLRQGVTLGISSRGVGSLTKNGEYNEVQDDFELIAFDFVSNPSTHGAFLSPVNESVGHKTLDKKWSNVESSITNILLMGK